MKLHYQIFIALFFAVIAGSLTGTEKGIFSISFYEGYIFVGILFINALKMLIVPLIVSSIIVGMKSISGFTSLRKTGLRVIVYYLLSSFVAIMIGLVFVNTIKPGIVNGESAKEMINVSETKEQKKSLQKKVENKGVKDIVQIFIRMVPPNIIKAAANGQMLGLIFFSILFGYFMMQTGSKTKNILLDFWQQVYEVMIKITNLIIRFSPIGIFGLVAKVVAETGFTSFKGLFYFFITVVLSLLVHMFVVVPCILYFVARVNPLKVYSAVFPALLTAFSSSSSSTTLPVTIDCVNKKVGVSQKFSNFILPLGSTVNMDGTALYECVAAIFIAQLYGLELTFTVQFIVVFTALITSIGVAGIPSASLVAISIILTSIGLPMEGIALIFAVDRILDMFRTSVNVLSDCCGTITLARLEKEKLLV